MDGPLGSFGTKGRSHLRDLWSTFARLLSLGCVSASDFISATAFRARFDSKVAANREVTAGGECAIVSSATADCETQSLNMVTYAAIRELPYKQCSRDLLPVWLFQSVRHVR
jgi:hypothetical protein